MTADRFKRVEELFLAAAALEPSAQRAFLDNACGQDAALRGEVDALLAHDNRPAGFFRTVDFDAGRVLSDHLRDPDFVEMPLSVGSYKPLRVLGEGGFGIVYLAEQQAPRRTVALKLIRPGLTSRSALRRFKYEADLLGRLHHPYIAQIYEAGTADVEVGIWDRRLAPQESPKADGDPRDNATPSRPPDHRRVERQAFVAMEFIDGPPLTRYAAEQQIDVRERLELMARVCDGVQHAHQKGIIHRDLKPGNILVSDGGRSSDEATERRSDEGTEKTAGSSPSVASSLRRSVATPRILDFGVARAADPIDSATIVHTGVGQLVGTIPYMSPEQISGDTAALDTRSDVYSLGVILFELLTGRLPYDVTGRTAREAARIIGEASLPRLSTLNRQLRGEIEVIVAKALERDRERRYQSAADLGDDLRRYLDGAPIAAKRDSALYLLRKQIRRYWAALSAAAAFMLLLAIFAIYAQQQSSQFRALAESEAAARVAAVEAFEVAEAERSRADASRRQLAVELSVSNAERGRLLTSMDQLGAAEDLLWREFLRMPQSPVIDGAMWEFYNRFPIRFTSPLSDGAYSEVAYSADGRWLLRGKRDGVVDCWDAGFTRCYASFRAADSPIGRLVVSDDGEVMAISAARTTVRLFRPVDGAPRGALPNRGQIIADIAMMPHGRTLLTAESDGFVRVWDIEQESEARPAHRVSQRATAVCADPDSRWYAAGAQDGRVAAWNANTGDTIFETDAGQHAVRTMIGLSDPPRLVVGFEDSTLRCWSIPDGALIASGTTLSTSPGSLAVSADQRRMFVGGGESLEEWDIDRWERSAAIVTNDPGQFQVALRRDSGVLATVHVTQLRFWDAGVSRGGVVERPGHSTWVLSIAVNPSGTVVATGDARGTVHLWTGDKLQHIGRLRDPGGTLRPLAFSPDGQTLAMGIGDSAIELWSMATRKPVVSIPWAEGFITALEYSHDGRTLLVGTMHNGLAILDAPGGALLRRFATSPRDVRCARFSRDGKRVLATSAADCLIIFDAADGQILKSRPNPSSSAFACLESPDGKYIAITYGRRSAELLNAATLETVAWLRGHNFSIIDLCFSSDGRMLASCSADKTIRLWDIPSGHCISTLSVPEGEVSTIAFVDGDRRLVSGGRDTRVRRWDLRYHESYMAGNMEGHLDRLLPQMAGEVNSAALAERLRRLPKALDGAAEDDR